MSDPTYRQEILSAIETYCGEFGWYLHPVDGKRPVESGWQAMSSNDVDEVASWFLRNYERGRATGIGVSTGLSGLLVVDIDGQRGMDTITAWERKGHPLNLDTRVEVSGRPEGGYHVYYSTPFPVKSRKRDGVDLMGHGKQVVIAPSRHPESGTRYQTFGEVPIAAAPAWLLDLTGPADQRLPGGVQQLLDETTDGLRHNAHWAALGKLVRAGWPDEQIVASVIGSPLVISKCEDGRDPQSWVRAELARWHDKHPDGYNYDGRAEVEHRQHAAEAKLATLSTTQSKVIRALLERGRELGSVKVAIGYEDLALRAACSFSTAQRATKKLIEKKLVVRLTTGHSGGVACTYHLLPGHANPSGTQALTTLEHTNTCDSGWSDVAPHLPPGADSARHAVLHASWRYLDALVHADGPLTTNDLATLLNAAPRTVNHHIKKLIGKALVERCGDAYRPVALWQRRLDELTIDAGQVGRAAAAAQQLDLNRRNRTAAYDTFRERRSEKEIDEILQAGGQLPDFVDASPGHPTSAV